MEITECVYFGFIWVLNNKLAKQTPKIALFYWLHEKICAFKWYNGFFSFKKKSLERLVSPESGYKTKIPV